MHPEISRRIGKLIFITHAPLRDVTFEPPKGNGWGQTSLYAQPGNLGMRQSEVWLSARTMLNGGKLNAG
jgi:hypothetical protein